MSNQGPINPNPGVNPYAGGTAASAPMPKVAPARVDPVAPLYHVKGWLKLIGWIYIVMGALYCLSIIYLIIGWLPLWIGILCTKAAGNLEAGYQNRNSAQLQEATTNLATVIKIIGVCCVIGLVLMVLGILFLIIALVGGGLANM